MVCVATNARPPEEPSVQPPQIDAALMQVKAGWVVRRLIGNRQNDEKSPPFVLPAVVHFEAAMLLLPAASEEG